MRLEYRSIGGNDLAVDFLCTCPSESFIGSSIEHLMNHRVYLYGYNDDHFFDIVNAKPQTYTCKCGEHYTQQWFRDGHVEVNFVEPITFPQGTSILCHVCDMPLFTLTRDAEQHEGITPDMLKAIAPQRKPRNINTAKCVYCQNRVTWSTLRAPDGKTYVFRMGELEKVY